MRLTGVAVAADRRLGKDNEFSSFEKMLEVSLSLVQGSTGS